MSGVEIGEWLIAGVLVILSAFFSSAESAFLALQNTARLRHLVSIGSQGAVRVDEMLQKPGRLLSTILLGNNLVNIGFTALVLSLIHI